MNCRIVRVGGDASPQINFPERVFAPFDAPHVRGISALVSVHAHRLKLLAPSVRDSGFTRVGQHDRRAVGCVQGE